LTIINKREGGALDVFGSDILDDEINRIADLARKQKILQLYSSASIYVKICDGIVGRAKELNRQGVFPLV
jgi:hypothetical protein